MSSSASWAVTSLISSVLSTLLMISLAAPDSFSAGGAAAKSMLSNTAARFAGGVTSRYWVSLLWSAMVGSSQLASRRSCTMSGSEPMASMNFAAASFLSLEGETQFTLAKKKVLFVAKPGSTTMSQSKPHFSVKVGNAQMPVMIMPSLPSVNRSQSPRPAISSAVGCNSAVGGDKADAFEDYAFYGGMPLILSRPDDEAKMNYLKALFSEVYIKDIVDRKKIKREDVLSGILDLLCSSVGSLTNPTKVTHAINSLQKLNGENRVVQNTVVAYMKHLENAFLFSECKRYDVKGKSYFEYPNKYYCEDVGLRNARIGFRQQELTHIMENIIYNELIIRRCSVDIGIVYSLERNKSGNPVQTPREIDFIASKGGKKIYIQSAYDLETEEKIVTENNPPCLSQAIRSPRSSSGMT